MNKSTSLSGIGVFILLMSVVLGEEKKSPFSDYAIIGERNLFKPFKVGKKEAPSILPEKKEKPSIRRMPEFEGMVLTGIVFIGDEFRAIIEDKRGKKSSFLRKGEEIHGAKVLTITEKTVVLDDQGKKIELALERESKAGERVSRLERAVIRVPRIGGMPSQYFRGVPPVIIPPEYGRGIEEDEDEED